MTVLIENLQTLDGVNWRNAVRLYIPAIDSPYAAAGALATLTIPVVPDESGIIVTEDLPPGRAQARIDRRSYDFTIPAENAGNAVQMVVMGASPTTLTFDGQTTASIAADASAVTVQTQLEALSNVAPGDVVVTGSAGVFTVAFAGAWAGLDIPVMSASTAQVGAKLGVLLGLSTAFPPPVVLEAQEFAMSAAAAADAVLDEVDGIHDDLDSALNVIDDVEVAGRQRLTSLFGLVVDPCFQDPDAWALARGEYSTAQTYIADGEGCWMLTGDGAASTTNRLVFTHDGHGNPTWVNIPPATKMHFLVRVQKDAANAGGSNLYLRVRYLDPTDGLEKTLATTTQATSGISSSGWTDIELVTTTTIDSAQYQLTLGVDSAVPTGDKFYVGAVNVSDISLFTAWGLSTRRPVTGLDLDSTNKLTDVGVINSLKDTNGNTLLGVTATANAVNYLDVRNNAAANAPKLAAKGSDTNISVDLAPQGTGGVRVWMDSGSVADVRAAGVATDIDLDLESKGTGKVLANGQEVYRATGTDVPVTDGGTGRSTGATAYGIITAGTTATGAQQTISPGTAGQILVSGGPSALAGFVSGTGTGDPVRATSPTITTPRLDTIKDTNGVSSLNIEATASAVNYLGIRNNATGNNPKVVAAGSDSNLSVDIAPKGNAALRVYMETGQSVADVRAAGVDSVIHLDLESKGTGSEVRVNGTPVYGRVRRGVATDSAGTTIYYGVPEADLISVITTALSADQVRYVPFWVRYPIVITAQQFEVTTGPGTNANVRVGIYAADSTVQPSGAPLYDNGGVAVASGSTGLKTVTGLSVSLTPGLYLSAINTDQAMTVRAYVSAGKYVNPSMGSSSLVARFTAAQTYGALPTPGTKWTASTDASTQPMTHSVMFQWTE